MTQRYILDASPLVALVSKRDRFHEWSKAEWRRITPPLLTCEAVITEACFLLQRVPKGEATVMALLRQGTVEIDFSLRNEILSIEALMLRYQSVPMSFADACLVRMTEQISGSVIMTLDSDFKIYRRHRNQEIPVIMPEKL